MVATFSFKNYLVYLWGDVIFYHFNKINFISNCFEIINHFWRYLFSSIMLIVHIQGQGKMLHILHCYIVLQCIYDIFHQHNRWLKSENYIWIYVCFRFNDHPCSICCREISIHIFLHSCILGAISHKECFFNLMKF